MENLRLFATTAEFEAVKENLPESWVTLTLDNNIVHYMRKPDFEANYVYMSYGYSLDEWNDGTRMDYAGEYQYDGRTFYKYSYSYIDEESGERITSSDDDWGFVLFESRNITKLDLPYAMEVYQGYIYDDGEEDIYPFINEWSNITLYGFASEPTNMIVIKHHDAYSLDDNGVEYVDLGLTSGTLWAKSNIGADAATEYGRYFQWGDTIGYEGDEAKTHSYWYTTPFNDGSNEYNEEAINQAIVEGKIVNYVLAPEYDAAHANMGGDWRMPTLAQIQELIIETTNEWVEDYEGTGVNGRKFTSKTDSSKYIFIPASGGFLGGNFGNGGSDAGLWSSTLYTASPYGAWYLYFYSDGCYVSYDYGRCSGFCVLGVL